jgi:hypothetical protein
MKPLLHWIQKGFRRFIIQSMFALLVGAPYHMFAGCCDFFEPDLSITLDNYLITFILLPIKQPLQLSFCNFSQKPQLAFLNHNYQGLLGIIIKSV